MSNNPYTEAALTYVRRPFSSLISGIVTVVVLGFVGLLLPPMLLSARHDNHFPGNNHPLGLALMAAAFLAGFLAMHVKDQFAESRSRLMPHFRRVHIAVAAVATLLLAVVAPALFTCLAGLRSIGPVAITVFVFGVMFWTVLVLANWMIWPIFAMWLLILSESARNALALIWSGQFEVQAVVILVIGVAIICLAAVRLFQLNEDMPEYHRRMPMGWAAKGQDVTYDGPLPHRMVDWYREQAMAHLTRHVQCSAHSPWSRICRWQLGMPTGWRIWLWGIFPVALLVFFDRYAPHRTPTGTPFMPVAGSLTMLPTILLLSQFAGWLTLRARTSGYELMLPVDRRAYVRQSVAALAIGYVQLWGVICAVTIGWWLVAAPARPPLVYLGSVVAVEFSAQIGFFGAMVFAWSMVSARVLWAAASVVCVFASIVLIANGCDDLHAQLRPGTVPMAAGSAALGVLLTYIAYRRWLATDFE